MENYDGAITANSRATGIKNGKITISYLNNGYILVKENKNNIVSNSLYTSGIKFEDGNQSREWDWSCVPNCAHDEIADMNWVEAIACGLEPPACLAVITIYCTAHCL